MSINKNILLFILILSFLFSLNVKASTYEVIEETSTTYTVTAAKTGNGAGIINGIDSASTVLDSGSSLTLTAVANSGSTFTGWSGDCSGTGNCSLTMNENKSVVANFTTPSTPPVTGGGGGGGGGGGSNTVVSSTTYVNPNNVVFGNTNTNTTTVNTSTYTFVKDLKVNARDNEVIKLQQFLNARGYTVASKGAGSPSLESTYFGPATQSALARFQRDNNITPAQGYFGLLTKAFINKLGGNTATVNTNVVTPPVVNTTPGKYIFTKNLTVNTRDPEVIKLQQFLNGKGYIISTKGEGSPGFESNYFGPATRSALARWQKDNGIIPAAGYFGALTKAQLNK